MPEQGSFGLDPKTNGRNRMSSPSTAPTCASPMDFNGIDMFPEPSEPPIAAQRLLHHTHGHPHAAQMQSTPLTTTAPNRSENAAQVFWTPGFEGDQSCRRIKAPMAITKNPKMRPAGKRMGPLEAQPLSSQPAEEPEHPNWLSRSNSMVGPPSQPNPSAEQPATSMG